MLSDKHRRALELAKKHKDFGSNGFSEEEVLNEINILHDSGSVLDDLLDFYKLVIDKKYAIGDKNVQNLKLSYLLGLTNKKPDADLNLLKRRTYGRAGFPDIDMDFDHFRRHEIIEYLFSKYGRENVGNIGTVQTLKTKAAVRRAIKVLDPTNSIRFDNDGKMIKSDSNDNFALENTILKTLPELMKLPNGEFINSVESACKAYPEFKKYMDMYPKVKEVASKIEGMISGAGSHAAGVILSPIPLSRICPLHVTTGSGEDATIATQFPMEYVEKLGLIKFDILGLKTKTAMDIAGKWIKESEGRDIDWNTIPLDDKKTLELLKSGKTDGCFQLENHGMKQTLMMIGIDRFEDLIVAVAMYRPGPKDYIPEYAKRKAGEIKPVYPHPVYKEICQSTYGILAYQEQLMLAFVKLSGLTASDGYWFMKGCAKKHPEIIASYKDKFIRGSITNGLKEDAAIKIWNDMEKFGGYAFNMAHAASYAFESYKTAYLKAYYPVEFMAARLSVEAMDKTFDDVEKYEAEAERLGITILPPDINESQLYYKITGNKTIRRPLLIKGIGLKAAEDIFANQPFNRHKDVFFDFCMRTGSAVNSSVIEAMYDAGMWNFTKMKKKELLDKFEIAKSDKKKRIGRPTVSLF